MRYEKPELAVVSQAHLAILEMHECSDDPPGKTCTIPDTGGCLPLDRTDNAYSVDE